jgi:hypothetical protein
MNRASIHCILKDNTFAKRYQNCKIVVPAPHQVRDKLQPESSSFKDFLDSGSLAQTAIKGCIFCGFATIS